MDLFETNEGSFYLTHVDIGKAGTGATNSPVTDLGARVGNDCCNAPRTMDVCSGDTYSSQVLYINFRKHCGKSFNGFTTPTTLPATTRSLSGVVSSKYT